MTLKQKQQSMRERMAEEMPTSQKRHEALFKRRKEVLKGKKLPLLWDLYGSEERVLNVLKALGCKHIIRNGWPDFGVEVSGRLLGIEVKMGKTKPSKIQAKTHKNLKRLGIEVIVVNAEETATALMDKIRKELTK